MSSKSDENEQVYEYIDLSTLDGQGRYTFFSEVFLDELLIVKRGTELKVVSSFCPHFGGPLEYHCDHYYCPWHGLKFNGQTFKSERGERDMRLKVYAAKIVGSKIEISK